MAETALSIPVNQRPAPAHAHASASTSPASQAKGLSSPLPRVTIRFCTQCRWMLRAAYFAQELLSTFSTSLGEVALQPATGGIFVVEIYYADPAASTAPATATIIQTDPNPTTQHRVLWDRKVDGGFPETKELKRRVRDVIEPDRNLGHVDRDYPKQPQLQKDESTRQYTAPEKDATPQVERKQQQQQQQQSQPLGPGRLQPNTSESSQSTVQGQQAIPDLSQTGPQSKTPGDFSPLQHKPVDVDGPIHDTRMPVMPPVAHDSSSDIKDLPSQARLQTQKTQEECEDCQ
ncbi:hypothetical protein F4860DRAFT_513049 [Xylaria cubensis]|nr:hypothetical protein F4860DRAFT_513049 [Xylaria cubensis]